VFPFFGGCLRKNLKCMARDLAACFLFVVFFNEFLVNGVVFGRSHFLMVV
jgi:hypothetical protein